MDDKTMTREAAAREAANLMQQLNHYSLLNRNAGYRKERQEDLMSRRIARKWDASKKAQMVRRLTRANQEVEQSNVACAEIERRLEVLVAQWQPTDTKPRAT